MVDDNVDAGDSLAELLRLSGHDVEVARSGTFGIDAAKSFRPDVALLDIGLPSMSGYELAARLKAEPFGVGLMLVAHRLRPGGRPEKVRRSRVRSPPH